MIYKTYEDFLETRGLYDLEDRYIFCKKHARKSSFVQKYDKIVFKDFYYLTTIQRKIADALGEKFEMENSDLSPGISHVTTVAAEDRKTEVFNVAHEILDDLSMGLNLDKACVVVRDRDKYEALICDVFQEAGIPVNLSKQALLLGNPFIKNFFRMCGGETGIYFDGCPFDNYIYKKPGDWAEAITNFLESQGYPERLSKIHEELELVIRDIKAYKAFTDLINDIKAADDMIPQSDMNFEAFIKRMRFFASTTNYIQRAALSGIEVLAPAMLRGLKFNKVYALGMVEGEFPRDFRPDWLIKDEERQMINERGYSLDTIDLLLKRERETFEFLTACSSQGYYSYPMVIEQDTAVLPSPFLTEVKKIADRFDEKEVKFAQMINRPKVRRRDPKIGINSDDLKQKIKDYFTDYIFSISSLNTYGECPYKFFLSRVLKINPQYDDTQYNAINKGNILHKILETFFLRHQEQLSSEQLPAYTEEITKITEQLMQQVNKAENFAHPKLYEIEKDNLIASIITYLNYHILIQADFKPYCQELGFGYDGSFVLGKNPDIKMCGKIDRIDLNSLDKAVIYDYKNSHTPDINEIEAGTNIQMPVYVLAAQKMLEKDVLGGAFVSMKKGCIDSILVKDPTLPFAKRKRKGILQNDKWQQMLDDVLDLIRTYVDSIRDSKFPLEPKKCPKNDAYSAFCDFTKICPYEGGTINGLYR